MMSVCRSLPRAATRAVAAALLGTIGACASDETVSDETVSESSVSDETVSESSVSDETVSESSVSESSVSVASTTTIASPEPIPPEPPDGMQLVWSDEFDGDQIDRSNWTYDIGGWGWGNGEAQYYTDRPENARVQNGLLVIELRQEQFEDSYFTSARLKTQGLREFQYGRIEARVKVPKGAGTWPAFWMLGGRFDPDSSEPSTQWPNVGEIDIMEYVGREPDLVIGTVHGPGYAGSAGISQWNRQEFEIGDEFHTFAIDWDVDTYFDLPRQRVGRREWVFDQPFFMILNLALGGTLGGNIAVDLEYPIQYYVDYVRVYQPISEPGSTTP
jgi:beta-glucanase (GH16 family)